MKLTTPSFPSEPANPPMDLTTTPARLPRGLAAGIDSAG
jgi:hypothetical protein